jgi:hypothetical protein
MGDIGMLHQVVCYTKYANKHGIRERATSNLRRIVWLTTMRSNAFVDQYLNACTTKMGRKDANQLELVGCLTLGWAFSLFVFRYYMIL